MDILLDIPTPLLTRVFSHLGDDATDAQVSRFVQQAIEAQLAGSGRRPQHAKAAAPDHGRGFDEHVLAMAPATDAGRVKVTEPFPEKQVVGVTDSEGREWLWGQVNRILPLKFVLRAILNVAPEGQLSMEDAHPLLRPVSRNFALLLRDIDERKGTRRDDRLDVGFPSGDDEDAALTRFLSQFFFDLREDGGVSGALPLLRFVGPAVDHSIGLTAAGLDFARLENPILNGQGKSGRRLSADETRFYVQHVMEHVPGEAAAFRVIAEALRNRVHTNKELATLLRGTVGNDWSESLVSTQRSGAMGRMLDLGLTRRERRGVRVRFYLTDAGDSLLPAGGGG